MVQLTQKIQKNAQNALISTMQMAMETMDVRSGPFWLRGGAIAIVWTARNSAGAGRGGRQWGFEVS